MIPAGKIDPELQKSSCRDDFQRGNASWYAEKLLQGWFPAGKIHPDLQEKSGRDDFQWGDSSWFAGNVLQGWFPGGKCILNCRKALGRMISSGKIHPELQESSCRDDFQRGNWSWFAKKLLQGWFPPGNASWFGWIAGIQRKALWNVHQISINILSEYVLIS